MDRLLWYVFAASRGGPTRIRIVQSLLDQPQNVHQLAKGLALDYKTVEYNLRVLQKHVLVVCPDAGTYGALYLPSKNLLAQRAEFEAIAARLVKAPPRPVPAPATAEVGKPTNSDEPRGDLR